MNTTDTPITPIAAPHLALSDGRSVSIRAMRRTDAAAARRFLEGLSPESRRARFLCTLTAIDDHLLQLLMAEDDKGPLAVVATSPGDNGLDIVGVAQMAPVDTSSAECAVTVADSWQRQGLGRGLLDALASMARERGFRRVYSVDSAGNTRMRDFARSVGAHARVDPDDPAQVIYELDLSRPA